LKDELVKAGVVNPLAVLLGHGHMAVAEAAAAALGSLMNGGRDMCVLIASHEGVESRLRALSEAGQGRGSRMARMALAQLRLHGALGVGVDGVGATVKQSFQPSPIVSREPQTIV